MESDDARPDRKALTSAGRVLNGALPLFRFLCLPEIACDLKLYRAFPLVDWTRSPQDILRVGYLLWYFQHYLGNHSHVVSPLPIWGEVDFHPLRSTYFREGSLSSVIDCPAMDLGELKACSRSQEDVYV